MKTGTGLAESSQAPSVPVKAKEPPHPLGRLASQLSDKQVKRLLEWNGRLLDHSKPMAFGVDAKVDGVVQLLDTGRSVALVGPRGVGKSAIAQEAIRRVAPRLGKSFVQLSIRRRQATAKSFQQVVSSIEPLTEALIAAGALPFFEDGDLLRSGLVEPIIGLMGLVGGPIVIEGTPPNLPALFEEEESLDEHLFRLSIDEPDVEVTQGILRDLAAADQSRFGRTISDSAIEESVFLGQRFLSRSQFPRKAIDLLTQAAGQIDASQSLQREQVLDRFCELHATPRWLVDPKEPLEIAELEARLRTKILGQDEAVSAAVQLVATMKTGLSDLRRPFGAYLFTGPTGVGKTHLAQTLAEILFGGRDRMVRINMGDYGTDEGTKLFGEPTAYQLSSRRGSLTQALLGRQFAVLLLDELEKADPAQYDRLLPLMDEGVFVNGAGELISCRSMIIIATTNAGAEVYRGAGIGFAGEQDLSEKKRKVEQRVRDVFRFEFLNRFDAIVHFDPLTREACRTIARRELELLRDRAGLRRFGLKLSVDESVLDWLAVHGYHYDFGARFMKRTIERSVTRCLAEGIVRRHPNPGSHIELVVRGRRIHCRVDDKRKPSKVPVTIQAEEGGLPKRVSGEEILHRSKPLFDALAKKETERQDLLTELNRFHGAWGPESEERIERFRELEIWVAMARRHAEVIDSLRANPGDSDKIAQSFNALLRWEEKSRAAGPAAIWMVLTAVDAHRPSSAWLEELCDMQRRFCRRCGLEAQVEAVELSPRGLTRIVLEVEGHGALQDLVAEEGLHRLRVAQGADAVARIQLVPKSEGEGSVTPKPRAKVRVVGGIDFDSEATVEIPQLGLSAKLLGRNQPTLAKLAFDVQIALQAGMSSSPARVYNDSEVTDPRTGVTIPGPQAKKGRLEPFLEGLLARPQSSALTWS